MGTCHDDGTTPGCDCPDGYYGTQCELPMVLVECDTKKMWINIVPYGYDKVTWVSFPPLTGDNFTCALEPVDAFFKKNQQYYNSEWRGFAGIFPHVGDSCAGNPIILRETATHITYGRIVYLAYRAEGPDPTDQTLRLTCDVRKPPPPRPPPTPLPPRAPLPFPAPQSPRASFPPRAPLPFPAPQSPRAPYLSQPPNLPEPPNLSQPPNLPEPPFHPEPPYLPEHPGLPQLHELPYLLHR
ncbi:hypothetical protein V1264_008594 [Littorina saxatilis]|uniref:EGF-like domain-containing protein n=1 Tax=Littorina saxatilis TaxID=31220 RepID=A0AAN9ATD4_9CAEN